jgi:hypothetical protein
LDLEDIGKGQHWHEALILVGGAIIGATVVSWFMTRDPFAWLKGLLGVPYGAMAATTNPDVLQSYIPGPDYIYPPWPEDYPMYPAYTQRPYVNIADDFTAQHGYVTRPYQRSYHANQVVEDDLYSGRAQEFYSDPGYYSGRAQEVYNDEDFELERDHNGRIISYRVKRHVRDSER